MDVRLAAAVAACEEAELRVIQSRVRGGLKHEPKRPQTIKPSSLYSSPQHHRKQRPIHTRLSTPTPLNATATKGKEAAIANKMRGGGIASAPLKVAPRNNEKPFTMWEHDKDTHGEGSYDGDAENGESDDDTT